MIHSIFELCVQLLVQAGQALGIGYEAINVWVFVIISPVISVAMAGVIAWQWAQIRRLKGR